MEFVEADVRIALKLAGVGSRHASFTPRGHNDWTEALEALFHATGLKGGFLAVLLGKPGTGKTQLATEWLRYVLRTTKDTKDTARFAPGGPEWLARHVRYVKASDLFREVRATFDKNDKSELEVVSRFSGVRALVIDEVDKRSSSEFAKQTLFDILDHRYMERRETVIISNDRTRRIFVGHQPDYLVSRLSETGLFVTCDWPSFRER